MSGLSEAERFPHQVPSHSKWAFLGKLPLSGVPHWLSDDCGLRPVECFRLRWEYVREGALNIPFGKTENARRTIPMSARVAELIEARRVASMSDWIFPAPTKAGISEVVVKETARESLRTRQGHELPALHVPTYVPDPLGCAHGPVYTRISCRPQRFLDNERYIDPQAQTVLAAIERARAAQSGHKTGRSGDFNRLDQIA